MSNIPLPNSNITIIMNHACKYTPFVLLVILLISAVNVSANDILANFDRRLDGDNASIFFHSNNEVHAKHILDLFHEAKLLVTQRLANSNKRVNLYLYESSNEMAQGVKSILNYNREETDAVIKVGITEQSNYTLHLHPKTAKWGSRLTHAIVDEHIHGVLQEKYGTGPSKSATWLEEGLTSYLAHELLVDKFVEYEDAYPERRFKVAFKALVLGELPKLDDVSTRTQWYSNINESNQSWDNQYALAYFSVSHLINNYGFDSVLYILAGVATGLPYKESIENVIDTTFDDFEKTMRISLLYTGLFQLYTKHTIFILVILAFAGLVFIHVRRSTRNTGIPRTNA